ncbi:hypothetical protein CAPTEDRAFT_228354 [Capitella teleta]|uniref:Uncharacterized protein n=1 Tax=Capitella teleta TaxID=283909 RepID=R7VKL2_CAPTE|nr:hypothetical protein CAPTEDRAFT_228354 [Capitella teleta]|eukprot:ELU17476.1 hypothetical protein CAPTEDRAFT_228354 [Capitella teleta]
MDNNEYSLLTPNVELGISNVQLVLSGIPEEPELLHKPAIMLPEVEIRTNNSRGRHSLFQSPSDPDLTSCQNRTCLLNIPSNDQAKTRSLGYIENKLTDLEQVLALRNLQRRSTQPEVFLFPETSLNNHNSNSAPTTQGHLDGYHSNGVQLQPASEDDVFIRIGGINPSKNSSLVRVDYAALFSEKKSVGQMKRTMSLSERAYHEVVRRVSSRQPKSSTGQRVQRLQLDGSPKPPNYFFDIALFSCCCCISPIGLLAIVFSVMSGVEFKKGNLRSAHRFSHATLLLAILGIGVTILVAILLLVTKFYAWDDVYVDKHDLDPGN